MISTEIFPMQKLSS